MIDPTKLKEIDDRLALGVCLKKSDCAEILGIKNYDPVLPQGWLDWATKKLTIHPADEDMFYRRVLGSFVWSYDHEGGGQGFPQYITGDGKTLFDMLYD